MAALEPTLFSSNFEIWSLRAAEPPLPLIVFAGNSLLLLGCKAGSTLSSRRCFAHGSCTCEVALCEFHAGALSLAHVPLHVWTCACELALLLLRWWSANRAASHANEDSWEDGREQDINVGGGQGGIVKGRGSERAPMHAGPNLEIWSLKAAEPPLPVIALAGNSLLLLGCKAGGTLSARWCFAHGSCTCEVALCEFRAGDFFLAHVPSHVWTKTSPKAPERWEDWRAKDLNAADV